MAGGALTPLYAAPEQLRGGAISTLTDVFALGVMLHELSTGTLPYPDGGKTRASLVEVLEAQARGELPLANIGGDLGTIVGKALRIAPEQRYGSVAHFAEDLICYLRSRPIAARRPSLVYRARLMLVRHRLAAAFAAAGLIAASAAGAIAWQQHRDSVAHEQRAADVRDFMFDLVNDAEAVEGTAGEVTGKQMVAGAVLRARRDFAARPQLQGELLGELGRMYVRLGAVDDAVPVLREAEAALEQAAPAGDPALNKARAFLADALLQSTGEADAAFALATRARADCAGTDVECAKARAYAGHVLSQVASMHGDDDASLVAMRQSAADVERAFGPAQGETTMALVSLAMSARNAGHLIEAGDALERATTLAQDVRLRAADRTMLERSAAVIDLDLGHYTAARDRLLTLLARDSSAFERAIQQRLLATVYVELGDAPHALEAADRALAGSVGPLAGAVQAYARQARARALALAGRRAEALTEIETVIANLTAGGSSPDSLELLRAQRYQAEFLAPSPAALMLLRELAARHARIHASPVEHGLVLDALAAAEARAGNGNASQLAHRAAREQLAKQLPEDHPFLQRNSMLTNKTVQGVVP